MVYARSMLCAVLLLCGSLSAAEETDPRVEAILKVWKKKLHSMQTYHLKGSVIEYDSVFEVERHADLEVGFERVGRRIVRWTVPKLDPELKSQRKAKSGDLYGVKTSSEDIWYCPPEHDEIRIISDVFEKQSTQDTRPSFESDISWLFSPRLSWSLSLLSTRSIEDNLNHFDWSIISEDENKLTLSARPGNYKLSGYIDKLEVEITQLDHTLMKIKLFSPNKKLETILNISEFKLDQAFEMDTTVFDLPEGIAEKVQLIPYRKRNEFFR